MSAVKDSSCAPHAESLSLHHDLLMVGLTGVVACLLVPDTSPTPVRTPWAAAISHQSPATTSSMTHLPATDTNDHVTWLTASPRTGATVATVARVRGSSGRPGTWVRSPSLMSLVSM